MAVLGLLLVGPGSRVAALCEEGLDLGGAVAGHVEDVEGYGDVGDVVVGDVTFEVAVEIAEVDDVHLGEAEEEI